MTGPTRRWMLVLGGLALLGVTGGWLTLRTGFSPRPARVADTLLSEPVAVAPGIYILGKPSPAAAYLVETSRGLVLIDSGLASDAASVTEQIAQLGFEPNRVRAILLTHVHADHSLGAERLRQQSGAKIYAGRADCSP